MSAVASTRGRLAGRARRATIQRRMSQVAEVSWSTKPEQRAASFGPNKATLRLFGWDTVNEARKTLTTAGMGGWKSAEQFLYIQLASTVLVTMLGAIVTAEETPLYSMLFTGVAVVVGYKVPTYVVKNRITQRRKEMELDLSFLIEVLTSLRETGLAFEQCLRYLGERGLWKRRPLFAEVEVLRADLDRGKPREVALKDFGDRTGVEAVRGVAAALIAGERHGSELGDVLRDVARSIMTSRERQADAESRKAPVKLTLPLVIFIFPVVMIMLMGPFAIRVMILFNMIPEPPP